MASPANMVVSWVHPSAPAGILQVLPGTTVGGVEVRTIDLGDPLDFGMIDWEAFSEPRVLTDGLAYYGGVWSAAREMTVPLWMKCATVAKALDTMRDVHTWFHAFGEGKLRIARDLSAGGTSTVWTTCYLANRIAIVQRAGGGGNGGAVGPISSGNLLVILKLVAPYPHFRDVSPTTALSGSYSGSTITSSVTGPCPSEVGLRFGITSPVGVSWIKVSNLTTGRYILLTGGITAAVTIDWFATDPNVMSVMRGTTDLIANVNVGAKLKMIPGAQDFEISASGGTFTYALSYYGEYDSV